MIQCAARRPDGSNSPFQVSSNILLDDLRHAVAEKLERFPDHVLLRYRLDSDKAKAGVTSINTDEELDIFKTKMRELILPQRLANGKLSTRPHKSVVVLFEDGNAGENTGAGNAKAVCINVSTCFLSLISFSRVQRLHARYYQLETGPQQQQLAS